MTMTDPVADYLTRVRNALQAKHKRVDIPASNLKREMTKLLLANKFIAGFTEVKEGPQGTLRIQLRYHDNRPVISGLKRVSTPGLRRYTGKEEVPRVLGGRRRGAAGNQRRPIGVPCRFDGARDVLQGGRHAGVLRCAVQRNQGPGDEHPAREGPCELSWDDENEVLV